MNRKVVFWLEPNQSLIPVDQIPGAIAEAKYPQPVRNDANGEALNDPDAVSRLMEERNQANFLRLKGIGIPDSHHPECALLTIEEVKSHLAELGLEIEIHHELVSKQRCIELAALSELRFEHWEELTGIGLGDGLYCCKLDGIYPEQYNENELSGLARTERIPLLEHANSAPLRFPCGPERLVKFVDDSVPSEFALPQWFREAVARKADAEFTGTFSEVVSNGRPIDWRYWMSMKTLSAGEAACLVVGLDPDIFTSLDHNGPTRNDTSGQRHRAKKIERLALNLGVMEATASEWLSWAKSNGFSIHRLFAIEVEAENAATKSVQLEPSTADDSNRQGAGQSGACSTQAIIDGFGLGGKDWRDILSRPNSSGKRFKDAVAQPGRRGRGKNGKSNSVLWWPFVFARLLIQHGDLNRGQVIARFKRAWPELEDEMMAEIGEMNV